MMGYRPQMKKSSNIRVLSTENVPITVDWTIKGAVTPVKDQG